MTQIARIEYKCVKTPEGTHLKGFTKGNTYTGRSFNGLYEVSSEWASHQPSHLIDKKEFDKFFVLKEDYENYLAKEKELYRKRESKIKEPQEKHEV
ncbi:MAG: hypothetical protein K2X86_10655 [Cytophagaceae bacterium]|nr:hypothetical protein [Cytophagaceae bacterium]